MVAALLVEIIAACDRRGAQPAAVPSVPTGVARVERQQQGHKVSRLFVVGVAGLVGDERDEMRGVIVDELSKLTGQLAVRKVEVGSLPVDADDIYAGGQESIQPALGHTLMWALT